MRDYIRMNTTNTKNVGYERYKKVAKKILEKTEKPMLRDYLLPYLEGKKIATRKELYEIGKRTEEIRKIMEEEGVDLYNLGPESAKNRIIDYLERRCKVSEADTEVVAAGLALNRANSKQNVYIGEKDKDIKQAIGIIRTGHVNFFGEDRKVGREPEMTSRRKKLICVDPYI